MASGFRIVNQTDIAVAINTVTRQDIHLEVGVITEQVTVSGTASLLDTDKSDVRHELTGATIQNMPLPGYHASIRACSRWCPAPRRPHFRMP